MMPLTLIGSLVGTYVLGTFPDLIIQVMLTIILIILAATSGKKFVQIYRKESEAQRQIEKLPTNDSVIQNSQSRI